MIVRNKSVKILELFFVYFKLTLTLVKNLMKRLMQKYLERDQFHQGLNFLNIKTLAVITTETSKLFPQRNILQNVVVDF